MEEKTIRVATDTFRWPLTGITAGLFALAALAGIPGAVMLWNGEYREYLMRDMMAGGVTSAEVLRNYSVINGGIHLISTFCAAALFVCLLMCLKGRPGRGLSILSTVAQWLVRGINIGGILAAALYVFRFIRYVVMCLSIRDGLYPLYAMVISEALMGALAGFVFVQLRKFLNCACDSAASMAYTLSSGRLDSASIPGFTATGFLILGVLGLLLAVDQMVTVTVVYDYIHGSYKLMISEHPVQICTAVSYFCGAMADFLLAVYLRRYKRICERALYDARKRILGK